MNLGLANQYMVHMESPGFSREEEVNATTIGTGVQIAMKPVLSHLLGESHVIESITDTRTDRNDTDNDNIDVMIPETDAA